MRANTHVIRVIGLFFALFLITIACGDREVIRAPTTAPAPQEVAQSESAPPRESPSLKQELTIITRNRIDLCRADKPECSYQGRHLVGELEEGGFKYRMHPDAFLPNPVIREVNRRGGYCWHYFLDSLKDEDTINVPGDPRLNRVCDPWDFSSDIRVRRAYPTHITPETRVRMGYYGGFEKVGSGKTVTIADLEEVAGRWMVEHSSDGFIATIDRELLIPDLGKDEIDKGAGARAAVRGAETLFRQVVAGGILEDFLSRFGGVDTASELVAVVLPLAAKFKWVEERYQTLPPWARKEIVDRFTPFVAEWVVAVADLSPELRQLLETHFLDLTWEDIARVDPRWPAALCGDMDQDKVIAYLGTSCAGVDLQLFLGRRDRYMVETLQEAVRVALGLEENCDEDAEDRGQERPQPSGEGGQGEIVS